MSFIRGNDRQLPAGAVTLEDLEAWDEEFSRVIRRISPLFSRKEPRIHAEHYLRGILAPLERKNGWTIAEYSGEPEPKALQRFLNLTDWDAEALRDTNLEYVMEHFADPAGVLIADPTGFAKKGKKSAGVQRQYSGTLGRLIPAATASWPTVNCTSPSIPGLTTLAAAKKPGFLKISRS